MKENLKPLIDKLQIAELDTDLIGYCKSIVDIMQYIRNNLPNADFDNFEYPKDYFKIEPHFPSLEKRHNIRKSLAYTYHELEFESEDIRLQNIFTILMASCLMHSLPLEKILEKSKEPNEFSREECKEMLLQDKMSILWIKDPSKNDFSEQMF